MTAARPRLRRQTFLLLPLLIVALNLLFAARADASTALHGRVLDPDGRPVSNAEVIVSGPMAAPVAVRTDAAGGFQIPGLAGGRYTIVASAPGLISEAVTVDVAAADRSIDITTRISALTETLVVSASQIDQPLSRTPDSVTVISGRDIEARQQFTLASALRSVPGLTLQQNGGPGSVTSLFTRGGESDFTLVLVDGVRANAFGGGIDVSQLPLEDVERIEVVRGPQSALYGSDAIGGVIQIVTRSGGSPSAQAQLETGSRAMRRAAASTTGEVDALRWQLGANYYDDEGFTGTAANGQSVSNDDSRERQVTASAGWRRAASGTDLQGSFLYVDTDRGSPGPFGSDPAGRYAGVNTVSRSVTNRSSGSLRAVQPWFGAGSRVRQRIDLDVADYDLDFLSEFGTSNSATRRSHARVQTDIAASASAGISTGVEWLREKGGSTYITSGDSAAVTPVERGVLGIFGEARWNAADRATLSAGVRAERISRAALPGDPLAFQPRPPFPEDTVASVNPKLAATVLVAGSPGARSWTRLRGALGTGIRPPDAFEIAFTDNSGLKPERSRSGEFGITEMLAGGAVQVDATMFVNSYTDLIISVGRTFAGVSRWRTDNISNARARGLEAGAAWKVNPQFDLRANYTFLDTAILAVSGSATAPAPYRVGDALLRRPRHAGSIDASWSHHKASAFAQLQVRGNVLDAEPAYGPTGGLYTNPGHTVVNLGASWRIGKSLDVFARAVNLFDRRYEEVFGYPAPGRTAYVGARIAVGR